LRGGDVWDRQIRRQIHDCALFVPIISTTTQARLEGYFRREWKLAVDRTHEMADGKRLLLPVVIDDTNDQEAEVPESFQAVQWTASAKARRHRLSWRGCSWESIWQNNFTRRTLRMSKDRCGHNH